MEPTIDKKSNGALVGAIIVILILVLGGVYLWTSNSLNDQDTGAKMMDEDKEDTQSLGELNEASVIEADLNTIDQENNVIDTDFTVDVNAVQ